MRIKRLQLIGFKSCMERAVLEFPRGITGVVGPNGCGKSNIVDALRWVLGEQSARHLRGQTMEDVIFAGNERYGALGAAEVAIVFDNESGLPHLDLENPEDEPTIAHAIREAPEIEVTRRLFRSGESEYVINGRSCRLRDITELFLGTGVGTKAYSIVEQGRVGQIVGAKPEDLRLYIEEAAGTTLYRSRKLAAERKIERTRNNLLRVNDLVQELERQAAALRRQARGAERYTELRTDEESLERRVAVYRTRKLDHRIAEVGAELKQVLTSDSSLTEESLERARERDAARAKQLEAASRIEDCRRELYEARGREARAEQERGFLERRLEELRRLRERAEHELRDIDARANALEREKREIQDVQSLTEAEVAEVSGARLRTEDVSRESESQVFDVGSRIEHAKASLIETLARDAALKNELAGLTKQRDSQLQRETRLRDEFDSLTVMSEQLVADISSCQARLDEVVTSLERTRGGKEDASSRLSLLLARKNEADKRLESARSEVATLRSKHQSLTELNASFAGYGDGVRTLMSNGGKEHACVLGVVADILDIAPGYERAVAAVLEDRLQYVVVADPDAGVRGAEYLRATGTGRASFIPRAPRILPSAVPADAPPGYSFLKDHVSARPGYEAVVVSLLDGVVVADTLEGATRQWKLNGTYVTFVTRDGEVLDRVGIITGGSGRPLDEGLLARKTELRALEDALARAALEVQDAERALSSAQAQAESAGDDLLRLDGVLHELTVGRVAAEGDLELRRNNFCRTQERAGAVEDDLRSVQGEHRASRERLQAIGTELADIARLLENGRESHACLEAEREQLEAARKRHAAELQAQSVREAELRKQVEHTASRLRSIHNSLEELLARKASLVERLEQDHRETKLASERLLSPDLDLARARSDETRATEGLASAEEQGRALADAERRLQERMEALSAEREHLRDRRSGLELNLKECALERDAIARSLRERIGVEITDALAAAESREEDIAALESELGRIRDALRRLGVVNLGAVAELEELDARLAEMKSQRDDLERSIEDLRGTIARLNRLSKQKFRETFEAVNAIFQRTFPKLFLGGKAWLALTDENNLLETGVEIFVRPPGKKLGNLDLLSGGEKALTAVSLIFSLFLYKPTPFCVLDEVDAPLDDANIGRFTRMVSEMSENSQFVLITHNKRTMECCDMLYGVTMREPGVSKIVSVEMAR